MSKRFPLRWPLVLGPLILLALAEGLGRAVTPYPKRLFLWPPNHQWNFYPDPSVLPGIQDQARFATNELGLRGSPRPKEPRAFVVAVGGSTTECLYLDQSEAWPELVEQQLARAGLPIWMCSSGRSGHSSRHHRLIVDMLLAEKSRPDVLILMAGINDFLRRLASDREYDPLAFDKSHLRPQLEYESFQLIPKGQGLLEPEFKTTGIWRLARKLRRQIAPQPTRQDLTGACYGRWRILRQNPGRLLDTLPEMDSALAEFRTNLEAMHASCERAGVRLLLVTQAYIWRKDMPASEQALCWMGGVGDYTSTERCDYYSIEALAKGQALYNALVLQLAHERNIECLDLEASFPKDGRYFFDDVHFNEAGCQLTAKIVADFLAQRPAWLAAPSR